MSAPHEPALALEGIARRFGRRWVLRGVDFTVARGSVVALCGRNGSGKTTLLRIISTALTATRGTGRAFGLDLARDRGAVRPLVGMLAHHAGLYDDLTASENLAFSLRMNGERTEPARVAQALEETGLRHDANESVRGFSAGMRRRLALARLLLRPPALLLLDEPYASFDMDGITLVNAFAARIAQKGGAVLVATHDVARGAAVLQRAVLLESGRLVPMDLAAALAAPAAINGDG